MEVKGGGNRTSSAVAELSKNRFRFVTTLLTYTITTTSVRIYLVTFLAFRGREED